MAAGAAAPARRRARLAWSAARGIASQRCVSRPRCCRQPTLARRPKPSSTGCARTDRPAASSPRCGNHWRSRHSISRSTQAAAAPFVRVLREMFSTDKKAASLVLPTRPLHEMYAEPARTFIERHGGEVRTGALARVIADDSGVTAVEVRGERIPTTTGHQRRPMARPADAVHLRATGSRGHDRGRRRHGVDADRHRQSLVRPHRDAGRLRRSHRDGRSSGSSTSAASSARPHRICRWWSAPPKRSRR